MTYFLLTYDRQAGKLLKLETFPVEEQAKALSARSEKEAASWTEPDIDVVLLLSESEEVLRRTHTQYFKSIREMAEPMAARLAS